MSDVIHPRVAAINAKIAAGGTLSDLDSDFLNLIGDGMSPEAADKRAVMVDPFIPDLSGYQNGADIPAPHLGLPVLFAERGPATPSIPFFAGDYDGCRMRLGARFYTRVKRGPGRGRKRQHIVYPPIYIIDSISDIHI